MPNQVHHGKRLYKQMAMEVAVRNPERYPDILKVLSKFEGRKLDNACILEIYMQLYKDDAISAQDFDPEGCTDDEIKNYICTNKTHNNEWGYPTGYQAAFTRYLKTLSELGFIYSQYNDTLHISPVAKALLNGELEPSEAFALQCMRFSRKSPYRRVLNDFNYFSFILRVIQKLAINDKKLSYPQFVLSLFSDDGDADKFINEIQHIASGNSDDRMYNYIVNRYSETDDLHAKVNKRTTVFRDYGNTVFRVLQFTGFISVDSSRVLLISLNNNRADFLDFLFRQDFKVSEAAKENEELYFEEIGSLPEKLKHEIISYRNFEEEPDELYHDTNQVFDRLIEKYDLSVNNVCNSIEAVINGRNDRRFWFMSDPLKLEFYITLLLYHEYGNEYVIHPNYKADSNGIPYEHAPASIGDIYITNDNINWLIEVTLIRSRTQQLNNETTNCIRHFEDTLTDKENYLSFVAPIVHEDTERMYRNSLIDLAIRGKRNIYLKTYDINSFISATREKQNLDGMKQERREVLEGLQNLDNIK